MANRRVEEQISALQRLAEDGPTPSAATALRKALGDRIGLVVAKAARIAGELQMRELIPELLTAFDRLFEKPVERDPQCWGKNAIAKALVQMDYREARPFARGARHVQIEPAYIRPEDTAPQLRAICVLALASCTDLSRDELLRTLVDLLMDPAHVVRLETVRALAQAGGEEAELLLRLKAHTGDEELPVTGQVFDSVLALEGERGVDFVARFLHKSKAEIKEEAALSLGSSRLAGAVTRLQQIWKENRDPDLRLAVLRALSASRLDAALDFLLDIVRTGRAADRADALDALELHRESEEIWRRVEEAIRPRASDGV